MTAAAAAAVANAAASSESSVQSVAQGQAQPQQIMQSRPVKLWALPLDRQLNMLRDGDLASFGFDMQSPPAEPH